MIKKKSSKREVKPSLTQAAALHPTVLILRKLDVDSLSPMEALTKLYELKRMAQS